MCVCVYVCMYMYIKIYPNIYIYLYFIQHTGTEDTQTYLVEVVILILNTKFL